VAQRRAAAACADAIVVASGGRALWDAFARGPSSTRSRIRSTRTRAASRRRPRQRLEPQASEDQRASRALFAFECRGGAYADFVELGRLAGLGAPSRCAC